jgi:hypothetical protein
MIANHSLQSQDRLHGRAFGTSGGGFEIARKLDYLRRVKVALVCS